ncbi:MAG: protein phosphatase 2C domain-containing protein [Acidobacteria bacterium]|nr:protein phosphatase 2C domain-containing protein [Acidobacteriota bacterium]MCA1649004.1 protein phosphatase 2C domain-containing protein [Acidobacteriota bacterium]
MSGRSIEAIRAVRAAGNTNPGLLREVNEDRFHVDSARGLFIVIDGVGGQAAGGKAADTAVGLLRARLERQTGPIAWRLREAIAIANNEINRLAGLRPEWSGMACVLTAVVIRNGSAIIGHVGDTRLYKLRRGRIEKVTRDHSPVGEREDAREISELDAMQHPRRNEVYRDVGSELHEPADIDFIDVQEISFEPDAALLLCTDGLTDMVHSSSINQIVRRSAGRPHDVVSALIDAANGAGGKDNVTVVYVEGEDFPGARVEEPEPETEITRRLGTPDPQGVTRKRGIRMANIVLLTVAILLSFVGSDRVVPRTAPTDTALAAADTGMIVVRATQSIAQALQRAQAGTTIVVEPGEYRETLTLKSHVRLISTVPHAAIVRLPGTASEQTAAIVARDVTAAALDGFRVVGDAATPLGTGVLTADSELSMSDVEITGAARVAIDIGRGSRIRVIAGDILDNPGSALAVRSGAIAAISHSVFARNGTGGGAQTPVIVEAESAVEFNANVFVGSNPNIFSGSSQARAAFARANWFVEARPAGGSRPVPRGRR